MKSFAQFLSYLFHPIFAPLYAVALLFSLPIYFNYRLSQEFINFTFGVVTLNLVVSPILVSLYLKRKEIIGSLEMKTTKERILPYLVSSILYGVTFFLFRQVHMPALYLKFFLGAFLALVILLLGVGFSQKISAHLAALGGICGLLYSISIVTSTETLGWLLIAILISGFVAAARLALKSHTNIELISGFLLGFGIQVILFS
jgi:hypothetical protein